MGHHIFTVPYHQTKVLDDVRAVLGHDGTLKLLKPSIYHGDPTWPDGILVYIIFFLQMLVRLAELSYRVTMHRSRSMRAVRDYA